MGPEVHDDREDPTNELPSWASGMTRTSVKEASAANFRTRSAARPSPDRFVIRPSLGSNLFGGVFVLLGGSALGIGLLNAREVWGFLLLFGIGALFCFCGFLLLVFQGHFDFLLVENRFRKRAFMSAVVKQISEVMAVQVISGGVHSDEGSSYETYQLNLVFKDEERTRQTLSNHTDRAWTIAVGDRLASFLRVPLLDDLRGIARTPEELAGRSIDAEEPPGDVVLSRVEDSIVIASDRRLRSIETLQRRSIDYVAITLLVVFMLLSGLEYYFFWIQAFPFELNEKPASRLTATLFMIGITAIVLFLLFGFLRGISCLCAKRPKSGWRLELRPNQWIATEFFGGQPRTQLIAPKDCDRLEIDATCRINLRFGGRSKKITPILDPDVGDWLYEFLKKHR